MITLLALAIRLRAMPPGVPTFPTRIEREREAYLLGLNRADHGAMDFLQAFVTTLVLEMFGNNATDLRAYLTDLQAFATRARILGII